MITAFDVVMVLMCLMIAMIGIFFGTLCLAVWPVAVILYGVGALGLYMAGYVVWDCLWS